MPGRPRILLDPTEDGWRATIQLPNEEITLEAPTFREAAVAAVEAERAFAEIDACVLILAGVSAGVDDGVGAPTVRGFGSPGFRF